jgi:hypothetical protein
MQDSQGTIKATKQGEQGTVEKNKIKMNKAGPRPFYPLSVMQMNPLR